MGKKQVLENTIIDVIEGFFGEYPSPGDVSKITLEQIEDFKDRVLEFSASQEAVDSEEGGEPVYLGGFTSYFWDHPYFSKDLALSLLYQPRLLVHDPLSEYFGLRRVDDLPKMASTNGVMPNGQVVQSTRGPRQWVPSLTYVGERDSLVRVQDSLDVKIQNLRKMQPLLRSGAVVARSQWGVINQYSQELLSSSRHDVKDDKLFRLAQQLAASSEGLTVWDNLRGARVSVMGEKRTKKSERWSWQPEFYYLAKSIIFAGASGGVYLPTCEEDFRLLKAKVESSLANDVVFRRNASRRNGKNRQAVLESVVRELVPDFNVDPETSVKIRESEDAFEDWRVFIRDLEREAQGLDDVETQQLVKDRIKPIIETVNKRTKSSATLNSLRSGALEASIAFTPAVLMQNIDVGSVSGAIATGAVGFVRTMYSETRMLDGRYRIAMHLLGKG